MAARNHGISAKVSDELKRELRSYALEKSDEDTRVTESDVIRQALLDYLGTEEGE